MSFFPKYLLIFGIVAVMLGIGQTYITVTLDIAYSAFMSLLALKSEGTDDDKQSLACWVIFCLFNVINQLSALSIPSFPSTLW